MPMPAVTFTNDLAIQHMQCRKQGAVALVVVRHRTAPTFLQRSPGCVRSNACIWLFSSTHSTKALSGGFIYNPTTSVSFSRNFASRDSLKVRLRCGLILCSCHKRFTVFLLTPCAFAISRQLQWVMPLGFLCKVA